jgi:catechol 2,3-dioxygenase-like lactoylglutathione lyase family enzyme
MQLPITGLSHLALRVTDLARAKQFYCDTLGFTLVLDTADVVLVNAGSLLLGLRGAAATAAASDHFDPFRVGLDHIALAVPDAAALTNAQQQLAAAGVPNNGVEHDALTRGTYISFYDPDGIAWELYLMPTG